MMLKQPFNYVLNVNYVKIINLLTPHQLRDLDKDIIGPLPITERNNQYIKVIVDYFTKWVEAEPLATVTSKDVIYFLSKVFARHGTPQVVTNGPQFNSELTRIFLDL